MVRSIEIQRAILTELSRGEYQVLEIVPRDTAFPLIQIGDSVMLSSDTKTHRRTTHNITIHTWSKATSSVESKQIDDYVVNALRDGFEVQGFSLDNWGLALLTTLKEVHDDFNIFHGVIQFEFTLGE